MKNTEGALNFCRKCMIEEIVAEMSNISGLMDLGLVQQLVQVVLKLGRHCNSKVFGILYS